MVIKYYSANKCLQNLKINTYLIFSQSYYFITAQYDIINLKDNMSSVPFFLNVTVCLSRKWVQWEMF